MDKDSLSILFSEEIWKLFNVDKFLSAYSDCKTALEKAGLQQKISEWEQSVLNWTRTMNSGTFYLVPKYQKWAKQKGYVTVMNGILTNLFDITDQYVNNLTALKADRNISRGTYSVNTPYLDAIWNVYQNDVYPYETYLSMIRHESELNEICSKKQIYELLKNTEAMTYLLKKLDNRFAHDSFTYYTKLFFFFFQKICAYLGCPEQQLAAGCLHEVPCPNLYSSHSTAFIYAFQDGEHFLYIGHREKPDRYHIVLKEVLHGSKVNFTEIRTMLDKFCWNEGYPVFIQGTHSDAIGFTVDGWILSSGLEEFVKGLLEDKRLRNKDGIYRLRSQYTALHSDILFL